MTVTNQQSSPRDTSTAHPSMPPEDGAAVAGLPGFTHRFADVNGTRLHAVVGGSGPALVLLHGWPTTWAEWRHVVAPLAAAGHTVIAPDLRGTGDSARPSTGYSKANVAEDVHQLVGFLTSVNDPEANRGAPQIDLVGTDIGMMVAYAYAAAHPAEVRRLVLAESLLPGFGLEELMNVADGGYWHFGFHMQLDVAEMLTAGKEAAYLGGMWAMFSPAGGLTEADTAEYLRHYAAPGGMRAGFQHYATLLEDGRANRAAFTDRLAMPVLVLSGELGIPQAQTLAAVRRVARDVTVDLVPHAGHAFAADNPTWVADRLSDWFRPGPSAAVDQAASGAQETTVNDVIGDTAVITPLDLHVPQSDLDDLRQRLLNTRWPDQETVRDTTQGPQLAKIRQLVEHWADGYDWRQAEALLNRWGQHTTVIDGLEIHFVHVRSTETGARPLLLTHGWPGSVLEFRHAVGPLTDPVAHGGSAEDAFDLVIPSLPGFGFSGHPAAPGWNLHRTAQAWATLMARLGYTRWYAQGGDLGAMVTAELAALEQQAGIGLAGIHLNMAPFTPTDDEARDATEAERAMLQEGGHYWQTLSAYSQQMSTRPQTIGYSLTDSPAGLAAWIYAMFQDVGGSHDQHGDAEQLFSADDMLDDIMLYWLPNAAASAARMYWEINRTGWASPGTLEAPLTVPVGISVMPGEYVRRSRRWAERRYTNLVFFNEVARGGHFALLEQPDLLVSDIRDTFRQVR